MSDFLQMIRSSMRLKYLLLYDELLNVPIIYRVISSLFLFFIPIFMISAFFFKYFILQCVMMFQVKCEKYWPEFNQEVTHGTVTIMNTSNQVFADYTFRQLNVSCRGNTRKVNVYKFFLILKVLKR